MVRRIIAFACALALPIAWTSGDLAAFGASTTAMACCASTDYSCAGMRTPDDCCKTIQHGHGALPSSTVAGERGSVAPPAMTPPVLIAVTTIASAAAIARTITRPHDPPHLHTFTLLI